MHENKRKTLAIVLTENTVKRMLEEIKKNNGCSVFQVETITKDQVSLKNL